MGTLWHIKQRNDESLSNFYSIFNKELAGIDQVITGGENICAFVRVLSLRGSPWYDSLSIILLNIVEQIAARVKSYIDLKITKEIRKKEVHEGKKPEQRLPKCEHDYKHHPFIQHTPNEKSMRLSRP